MSKQTTIRHVGDETYTPCDRCPAPVVTEVEDATEQPDGTWTKAAPRRGCQNHPVGEPMVIFKDGKSVSFSLYERSMNGVT
jgi:hypothetical protein